MSGSDVLRVLEASDYRCLKLTVTRTSMLSYLDKLSVTERPG